MADDYICNVCHQKVKTKLKRAHETGAKHRANVQKLSAPKRPAPTQIENEPEPIVSKKARPEPESIEYHSAAARRPKEEVEEEPTSTLPSNFFDVPAKEKAAAATAKIENEYSKFMNEMSRLEQKEDDTEEKEDAIRNDLEMIDEQIEMWRNLNELEKQKDQLVADAHARVLNNDDKEVQLDEDDEDKSMDGSDNEFDAFGLDWRSRKI